jgi:hypothetical protein
VLPWAEAEVSGDLTRRLEAIQRQAGQDRTGRGQPEAGNGHHHPHLRAQRCLGSRQLGQFAIDMRDLGLDDGQDRSGFVSPSAFSTSRLCVRSG